MWRPAASPMSRTFSPWGIHEGLPGLAGAAEMHMQIIMALDDIDSSDAACWHKPRCTLHFSPVPVRAISAASDEMSANLV